MLEKLNSDIGATQFCSNMVRDHDGVIYQQIFACRHTAVSSEVDIARNIFIFKPTLIFKCHEYLR